MGDSAQYDCSKVMTNSGSEPWVWLTFTAGYHNCCPCHKMPYPVSAFSISTDHPSSGVFGKRECISQSRQVCCSNKHPRSQGLHQPGGLLLMPHAHPQPLRTAYSSQPHLDTAVSRRKESSGGSLPGNEDPVPRGPFAQNWLARAGHSTPPGPQGDWEVWAFCGNGGAESSWYWVKLTAPRAPGSG